MTPNNFKFLCFFVAALTLAGCSGPQPLTQESENGTSREKARDVTPTPETVMVPAPSDENNIYFTVGSTSVDQEGKDKLRLHAQNLKRNPKKRLNLLAHTDDSGSRNYNLAIAEERLMAVFKVLRSYGVPAQQIRRNRINGAKKPQICQSAACQLQMRRVELVYSP